MKSLQNFTVKRNFLKNLSSYLLLGLLFFTSCQEIQERPLDIKQETTIEKFDRLVFLRAVNKATKKYQAEARDYKKSINFRSINDFEQQIEQYVEHVADGFNTNDSFFNLIPESSWDDPYQNHVFTNEATLDKNNLSPRVRLHVDQFEAALNHIADSYELDLISEIEIKEQLKTICKNRGNIIETDINLSISDREDLSDVFYILNEITDELSLILEDPIYQNGFIRTKLGRALVRTLLVAAITIAVVYTAGLVTPALKMKSLYLGHKAAMTAITTKTTVLGGKMYSALTYGLGKGLIGGVQKWNDEWKGIGNETLYAAVKVAW